MRRTTPWTNPAPPSSDRNRTQVGSSTNTKKKNKNKKSTTATDSVEHGKSRRVRELEGLLRGLKSASSGLEKDPKGGCYCLARVHDISPYTPICHSCGLIICSLNQPFHCCPSCQNSLLLSTTTTISGPSSLPSTESILISQVESQLSATIAQEIEDHERALEEVHKAIGAFPALHSSFNPGDETTHDTRPQQQNTGTTAIPANQTHKVLTLTSKSKNKNHSKQTVTVSSYTTRQHSQTHPPPTDTPKVLLVDDEPKRVGPPKPPPVTTKRPNPARPFENFLHGSVLYIPT